MEVSENGGTPNYHPFIDEFPLKKTQTSDKGVPPFWESTIHNPIYLRNRWPSENVEVDVRHQYDGTPKKIRAVPDLNLTQSYAYSSCILTTILASSF